MGTQRAIAEKIRNKKADYVLALKGNQSSLHDNIKLFLSAEIEKKDLEKGNKIVDFYENIDKGHGRIETRFCFVTDKIDWLEQRSEWKDLKTIAAIKSVVIDGEKKLTETRYFISSLKPCAQEIAHTIGSHWLIENSLHCVLDVTMGEDNSRVRKDNTPIVRHNFKFITCR